MEVTFSGLNDFKFNDVNEEHPSNMLLVLVTFSVLNEDKSSDFKL